jgi:hypothetical protein
MRRIFTCRGRYRSLRTNNNGFILPFTLFLFFLFSAILFHAATKLMIEKQVFTQTQTTYDLDTLLLMAYEDVKKAYKDDHLLPEGELNYDAGYVKYQVKEETETNIYISFECYTKNQGELFMDLPLDKTVGEKALSPPSSEHNKKNEESTDH